MMSDQESASLSIAEQSEDRMWHDRILEVEDELEDEFIKELFLEELDTASQTRGIGWFDGMWYGRSE